MSWCCNEQLDNPEAECVKCNILKIPDGHKVERVNTEAQENNESEAKK